MERITPTNITKELKSASRTSFILLLMIVLNVAVNPVIQGQENKKAYINNATIEEQFNHVIDKSSKWENYKVVTEGWLNTLRKNALDSLNTAKTEIENQKSLVSEKLLTIKTLETTLEETQEALNTAIKDKNSFPIFGLAISKGLFLTTTWLIIICLAAFSVITLGLYKKSFSVIKKTKEELEKNTIQMESYRQETRKKHEQLVMQHHKEIQKLKGN